MGFLFSEGQNPLNSIIKNIKKWFCYILPSSIKQLICVEQDLTQEKTIELIKESNLRLEIEMRTKTELLAMISHDLKSPLQAIIGFTECLLAGLDGPLNPAQKITLQHSYQASQHLLQLIKDLSQHAKHSLILMNDKKIPCNLVEILDSAIQIISPLAKQKKITLEKNVQIDTCIIKAMPQHIMEIFLNLLSNAVKFTQKGKITSSIEYVKPQVKITIADTGIGIDKEHLKTIFTPFAASPVDGTVAEHTGLGLSITKKLVETYQGKIEVKSEKGVGSQFIVYLPLEEKNK